MLPLKWILLCQLNSPFVYLPHQKRTVYIFHSQIYREIVYVVILKVICFTYNTDRGVKNMLNILISDAYKKRGSDLLDDEDFYEEVIAEATADQFLLTCSVGADDEGDFVSLNLFYEDGFSECETIPLHKINFDIFDEGELMAEMEQQFRRLLIKAANDGVEDAVPAQNLLNKFAR